RMTTRSIFLCHPERQRRISIIFLSILSTVNFQRKNFGYQPILLPPLWRRLENDNTQHSPLSSRATAKDLNNISEYSFNREISKKEFRISTDASAPALA